MVVKLSYGAIDEKFRHAISKLSTFHLTSCDEYRRRVIQLGVLPKNVLNIGSLSIADLKEFKGLSRLELEDELGIELRKKILLVTYHPVTTEVHSVQEQTSELLEALTEFKNHIIIFTGVNADTNGNIILKEIKKFTKTYQNAFFFESLGKLRYFSLMTIADVMIGNSSSGIIEAASFKLPVVNIGNRQAGRSRSNNVIDCKCLKNSIGNCIHIAKKISKKKY